MNAVYPHGNHGNAILSRHRIVDFTNHDISDHVLEKRGLLHAVMRLGPRRGKEVHLICVHFGLIKRSRVRQATFLADFRAARSARQGAADHRRRFQRLAAARRRPAARPARRRGSRGGRDAAPQTARLARPAAVVATGARCAGWRVAHLSELSRRG
jgi:endonuclease/exonuclease/phosphatase family metal-dependent hydrolase